MKIEETEKGVISMLATFIIVLIIGVGIYGYGNIKDKRVDDGITITTLPAEPIVSATEIASTTVATSTSATSTTTVKASGVVKKAYTKGERKYIDIDYVTFEKCDLGPNGDNCMIQGDSAIRTLEVSANAKIKLMGVFQLHGLSQEGEINWNEFRNVFTTEEDYRRLNPWDIKVQNSIVVELEEHFLP